MTFLNERQQAAVEHPADLVVVRAPAGSGKTRTLVERAHREIAEGGQPVVLTFTRAAAREFGDRLEGLESKLAHCGTLHALALKLLRRNPDHLPSGLEVGAAGTWAVASEASSKMAETMGRLTGGEGFANLHRSGLVSYDELIEHGVRLVEDVGGLRGRPLVLIDEAQDLTAQEWRLVRALSPRRFVVGDAAQAIYGWRGGNVGQFLRERLAAGGKIDLSVNYRSRNEIIRAANRLEIPGKVPMAGVGDDGRPSVWVMSEHEAFDVARDSATERRGCGVLARTRRSARKASMALTEAGIPHVAPVLFSDVWRSTGGKAVVAALHVLANPMDSLHLAWLLSAVEEVKKSDLLRAEAGRTRSSQSLWAHLREHGPGPSMVRSWSLIEAAVATRESREIYAAWWQGLCELTMLAVGEIDPAWIAEPHGVRDSMRRNACMALHVVDRWIDNPAPNPTRDAESPAGFLAWLADPATSEHQLVLEDEEDIHGTTVTVTTIHGAKGLEWDRVVLWDCVEGVLPTRGDIQDEERLREARRLFYVATTRAREDLVYVVDDDVDGLNRPSRFIAEAMAA